jgi:hypothetical protein
MFKSTRIVSGPGLLHDVCAPAAAADRFANSVTSTTQIIGLNYRNFHVDDSSIGKAPMHCCSGLEEAAAVPDAFASSIQA